jgi:hypothetical protein
MIVQKNAVFDLKVSFLQVSDNSLIFYLLILLTIFNWIGVSSYLNFVVTHL